MIIRRGTLSSECKHGLKRRVCATCRQQLRDKLLPSRLTARRADVKPLSESGRRHPDIPAGLPGNGKRR